MLCPYWLGCKPASIACQPSFRISSSDCSRKHMCSFTGALTHEHTARAAGSLLGNYNYIVASAAVIMTFCNSILISMDLCIINVRTVIRNYTAHYNRAFASGIGIGCLRIATCYLILIFNTRFVFEFILCFNLL
jgi:hypothetical protein